MDPGLKYKYMKLLNHQKRAEILAKSQRGEDLLTMIENPTAIKEILGKFDNMKVENFHNKQ